MDNSTEEEETLPSPSLELENNSTPMVRVDPHEEPQDTELQCVLQSASEVDESQPGGVGGEPQPPEPQPAVSRGEDLLDNVRDSVDEFSESQLVGGYNESGLSPLPLVAVEGALSGGREEKKQDVDSRYDSPPSPLPVLMPDVGKDEAEDVLDGEKRAEVDGRKDVIDGEGIQGPKSKTEAGAETEKEADALEAVKMVVADVAQETTVDDSKAAEEVQERAILEEKGVGDATEEMGLPPEEKRVGDVTEEMGMPPEEKKLADFAEERQIPALEKEIADIEVERESLRAKEVADVGEETGIAGKLDIADVKEEKEIAEETKMADVVEEVELEMEEDTKMAHVAEDQEMGTEVAEMEEEVQPAEETEMAVEAERVKVPEETAMAGIMDRMKTADGKDGLEKETEAPEMADVAEGMETAEEMEGAEEEEARKSFGGKRKRGRIAKVPAARGPGRKKVEEDVCFICFDGGDLVLCDRRGCPKAYHPTCVGRDEAFFRAKGKWNCGWHLCSKCEKNAHYMCYTCTFSLCKGCIKDAVILCVRGNKGLCETCMETVRLIERNEQEKKETAQVDFDDKSSWEYLFKDYWIVLKERLSITPEELAQAKNPWKGSDLPAYKQESPDDFYDTNNDGGSGSESSSRNVEQTVSKRRKTRRRLKADIRGGDSPSRGTTVATKGASVGENVEWASKELLEVIVHMRNGDRSFLPQSEVHNLLLEYIKRYNLRDPRRKSQVICDSRLQNLFGKPHVGHFEMLNLLDSHFLVKEDSQADDLQESVVDTEANNLEADENSNALIKAGKDKRRKRKRGDDRGRQSNLDDYAAIDMHNINLIYLRRNLVEDLLEDAETFQSKVIGAFVRIRISGSAQKQDLYRLVQVVGTNKVAEPYKVGKRTTDILLEILNLNKTEVISIDIISNQEFTEDECKRLRQSIKCGLINRLTVGDIQEKAMALQEVRVKDWLEAEIVRLSHLRDRASEKGRRKELRECVEKLQLLKSPEERRRRLEEIPEIHADPNMDPSYESEEDEDFYLRPRGSGLSRRGREPISPHRGGFGSTASWSGTRNYSNINRELSRTISSKGLGNKGDDSNGSGEIVNENLWSLGRDRETQKSINWEKPKTASISESGAGSTHSVVISESSSRVVSEISPASAVVATQTASQINETEKIWHYQDPSGKVQGPFSMVQLRKWSNTGYFPAELRIWRAKEKQDESILLTDALAGKFQKSSIVENSFMNAQMALQSGRPHGSPLQQGMEGQVGERSKFDQNHAAWNPKDTLVSSNQSVGESWKSQPEIGSSAGGPASSSLEIPKHSQDTWASDTNLPSPTPNRTATLIDGQVFENKWSPTSVQSSVSLSAASQFPGGTAGLQPSAGVIPESAQLLHSSTPPSSLIITAGIDGPNLSHSVSPAPKPDIAMLLSSTTGPQIHSQSVVTGESNRLQVNAHLLPPLDSVGASVNLSGSVPRPEMTAPSPKPGSGSQAWGSVSQKLDSGNSISLPAQPPAYSVWGDASSSAQHAASSFGAGNPGGIFPAQTQPGFPSSDAWKLPVPSQSNVQAPAPPNLPWGMGIADNKSTVPRQGPDNQNGGWGPVPGNQNMGWVGHLPANMNWGSSAPGPAQGNTNLGWVAAGQGQAHGSPNPGWAMAGQGQPPGNAMPGWIPPAQGPAPVNTNPGWVASNQGPVPGNVNPGWAAPPSGNQGAWGNEPSHNGDRFSNRERGSQGGDPGYGGAKPWNRQSSFGSNSGGGGVGGSARPPFKGQRVCKYHENGHCKKGAQCDYLHT